MQPDRKLRFDPRVRNRSRPSNRGNRPDSYILAAVLRLLSSPATPYAASRCRPSHRRKPTPAGRGRAIRPARHRRHRPRARLLERPSPRGLSRQRRAAFRPRAARVPQRHLPGPADRRAPMPDGSGPALAERLRRHYPRMHTLYLASPGTWCEAGNVLVRPFSREELARRVDAALTSSPAF